MTESLGHRIFLAHLELSYRLGRKVTLAELGALAAEQMGRKRPFTAASVSRWESGAQAPTLPIIEAIGEVTGTDPGWLSHGARSAAPAPRGPARDRAVPASGFEHPLISVELARAALRDGLRHVEPQDAGSQGNSIRLGSPPKS